VLFVNQTTTYATLPKDKTAIVSFELRLPLQYTPQWQDLYGADVIASVSEVVSSGVSEIRITGVRSGSVLVGLQLSVSDVSARQVSASIESAVVSGALHQALHAHGVVVAWIILTTPPILNYPCSTTFLPITGRLECGVQGEVVAHVTQPCECSHVTQLTGHTHFHLDLVSGACTAFSPLPDSCMAVTDRRGIDFISGRLLFSARRMFGHVTSGQLQGSGGQHRSEKDVACCADQCLAREWCVSFDWHHVTQLCVLHNTTLATTGNTLASADGSVHYEYTGYDVSLPMDRDEAESDLRELTFALVANLRDIGSYLTKEMVAKDLAYERVMAVTQQHLTQTQTQLELVTANITQCLMQITQLSAMIDELNVLDANLSSVVNAKRQIRETEVKAVYEEADRLQKELTTIRELRELVEGFLAIEDTMRSRALKWLSHKRDLADVTTLWKPFHGSGTSLYTSEGLPRNKINADDSRFTGYIDCSGERGAVYSLMAEAGITYSINVYTKGYSLTDPVVLVRRAPSLEIVADRATEGIKVDALGVGTEADGMVALEDALPRYTIRYPCTESGWHVIEVTSFDPQACGSFGLSIVSSAPPFMLVVDGKRSEGGLACNTQHNNNNTAVFVFDGVRDVSYLLSTFTKDAVFRMAGTVTFIRDTRDNILSDASTPTSLSLTESKLRWTCPHNGRYEIRVTAGDGVACGSFGIRIVTLSACARTPCPRGTVCEDLPVAGHFICRQPLPHETAPEAMLQSAYGITTTLWLNVTWFESIAANHTNHILSAATQAIRFDLPINAFSLTSLREDSGGVAVTIAVALLAPRDAVVASEQLSRSVLDGSFQNNLQRRGMIVSGVWLLAYDVTDDEPTPSPVEIVFGVSGLSEVALRSSTMASLWRVALASAVIGVKPEDVEVLSFQNANISVAEIENNKSNHTTSSGIGLTNANTTDTTQIIEFWVRVRFVAASRLSSLYIARAMRSVPLVLFVNEELTAASLPHSVRAMWVNDTTLDDQLTIKNQLEMCSDVDQCGGCNMVWSEERADWLPLATNASFHCSWISSVAQCMATDNAALVPCQRPASEMELQLIQPQLIVQLRGEGLVAAAVSAQMVRAVMWAAQISDMSQVAVLDVHESRGSAADVFVNATATVVIGLPSRDAGVVLLNHVTSEILSGRMALMLTSASNHTAPALHVLDTRLSNPTKTGVRFEVATSSVGQPGKCERVTVDTGGCSPSFNLTSPYANGLSSRLVSPDGNIEVPASCDVGKNFPEAPFPKLANLATLVFMDARHVDMEREVPHLLAALPSRTTPQSAIALTHTTEEWQVSLAHKAFVVLPKINVVLDEEHMQLLRKYVARGGHVIVSGSPLRGVQFVNSLVNASVTDVPPAEGGVSFMPGTNIMSVQSSVAHSVLARCTSKWTDQNSFNYVQLASLPVGARALYVTGADKSKVAVFDYMPPSTGSGSVVYFGFDFYDVPSRDTACVLRHVMALQIKQ